MLSDFDIAMSAALTALFVSMGEFYQAAASLGLSLYLIASEGD